ncbi:hypothetical protein HaLaN_28579 [Haematococcus lacustris]|uniref:Uncharacterized protein n=1 Tax=Haematococcus lacustris TaxID=44745 RepID=A0A6A0ACR3_HAELA|nr:hypothetical protein HaLaN_28579 [Haematococcus lacustris]
MYSLPAKHLAAASSAGTSLEANLKHITVTLATWDAMWEVYLDPKSAVNGKQPCPTQQPRGHTGSSLRARAQHFPPAKRNKRTKVEQRAEPTNGTGKAQGKAAKRKLAQQPGSAESRWQPLELCYWPDLGALPAKGKEYPGLGYKRLRDKPPKA